MMHPWPKDVTLSYCHACGVVGLAKHVKQLDRFAARFCSRCGGALAIALFRHDRELPQNLGHPLVRPWRRTLLPAIRYGDDD